MNRRDYLTAAGVAGVAALAGCAGDGGGDTATEAPDGGGGDGSPTETGTGPGTATETEPGTLTVATYPSLVEGDTPIGPWLKQEFEAEFDATVEFATPESRLNYYIRRAKEGVDLEADLYVGLNVDQLLRIENELDEPLFQEPGEIQRRDRVREGLDFDPDGRVVPYDTGYISLVYDESEVDDPGTFDALTTPGYRDTLIVENAQTSATGRAFLLWSIHNKGADEYLDYWRDLKANEITVVGSWSDAYTAYSNGEKPMVVSYSTDQVYANRQGQDMTRHQVGFLNDQGYANPEGMARFADAGDPELARQFMAFVLRPRVQGEIAVRNVQFPAVDDAELTEEFEQYAKVPPEPVTFTYEDLKGNVDEWVEAWAREIAQD
jgi:thiamine transport system substrate-binding protein